MACAGMALAAFGAGAEDNRSIDVPYPAAPPSGTGPARSWFNPGALDLNVYGFAFHPDREAVHRSDRDNEFNPGLGLHYELAADARGTTFAEVGAYADSGSNLAKFAALGYQFRLGRYWKAGGALALMNSETYNDGVAFIGMIPLVTLDLGRVKLNAVYFPRFGKYNEIDAFGFYLGLPIGAW